MARTFEFVLHFVMYNTVTVSPNQIIIFNIIIKIDKEKQIPRQQLLTLGLPDFFCYTWYHRGQKRPQSFLVLKIKIDLYYVTFIIFLNIQTVFLTENKEFRRL